MALIQVRDVPDEVTKALRTQAAEQGMTLTAYLRRELTRMAQTPSNAAIIERIAGRNRISGPTEDDVVSQIRRLRENS